MEEIHDNTDEENVQSEENLLKIDTEVVTNVEEINTAMDGLELPVCLSNVKEDVSASSDGLQADMAKMENESSTKILQENVKDVSNKDKIAELLARTNYSLTLSTGQRRYGGPPPGWEGPIPGEGDSKSFSQIHIGKMGRRIFEDTLVPILEKFGKIYELRIMVNPQTGENKGYGFCLFSTKEEALNFQKEYDKKTIPENGGPITVTYSPPNMRLYVGGIPKFKPQEDIKAELFKLLDGLEDVVMYNSLVDKSHNRGFAFLQFKTHQDASSARKKIASRKIQIFSRLLTKVDWADPIDEEQEAAAARTKTIFVRNLAASTSEAQLKELFKEFGDVGEIKKLKDYAFLTYSTRESAEAAQSAMNKKEIDGFVIDVDFSKTYDGGRKIVKKHRRETDRPRESYSSKRFEQSSRSFSPNRRRYSESRGSRLQDYASGKDIFRQPVDDYPRSRSPIQDWNNDYSRSSRSSRYMQSSRGNYDYDAREDYFRQRPDSLYGMNNSYADLPYEPPYEYNRGSGSRPLYRDMPPMSNSSSGYWTQQSPNDGMRPKNVNNPYPSMNQNQLGANTDRGANYYVQRYSNPSSTAYPPNPYYGSRPSRPTGAAFSQPTSNNPNSIPGSVNFW